MREFDLGPFYLDGNPIEAESRIGFRFSIDEKSGNGNVENLYDVDSEPGLHGVTAGDGEAYRLWARKISGAEPQVAPGLSGSVYLVVVIGADGKVQDVRVIGGDGPVVAPVVEAVREWVFHPELANGTAAPFNLQQSFHFGSGK